MRKLLLALCATLLFAGTAHAQPPTGKGFFLPASEAYFALAADSNVGDPDRCQKVEVQGQHGKFDVIDCKYNSGGEGDAWESEIMWNKPYDRQMTGLTPALLYFIVYAVHDDSADTSCASNCLGGSAWALAWDNTRLLTDAPTATNQATIASGALSMTDNRCVGDVNFGSDGTVCSDDTDCSGAGECYTQVGYSDEPAGTETIVDTIGPDVLCDTTSCLFSHIQYRFSFEAASTQNYDMRIYGMFVITP